MVMAASKTAGVYDDLKEELLNGAWAPGAKLAIDPLATHFDVSASAVREALARLTSDRLVNALPQRGFTVAAISRADLEDLTNVRVAIEANCLRNSIENGTLDWEAQLLASWHRLSGIGKLSEGRSHPDWPNVHAQFHDALVAACTSTWWLHFRAQLYVQAERYRRMLLPRVQGLRNVESEHEQLLELTLARKTDEAVHLMADHLRRTTSGLIEAGLV